MESTEKSSVSSNPFLFKSLGAQPLTVPESSGEKVTDHIREPEHPITEYREKMGKPYLVDVLGIDSLYNHELWHDKVNYIDSMVMNQLAGKGLEKTKTAYRSVYEKLLTEANIDPLTEFDKKVERLAAYLEIIQKQKQLEQQKRELGLNAS